MSNFKSDSKSKEKPKICSVEEALRLHEGYVTVSGAIAGISGTYKMIGSASKRCNCRDGRNHLVSYEPAINQWQFKNMIKCAGCESTAYLEARYTNAISIILRNPSASNSLETIEVILFDKYTRNIVIGENARVYGKIYIPTTKHEKKPVAVLYASKIEYHDREDVKPTLDEILGFERFAEEWRDKKNKDNGSILIDKLVEQMLPSVIGCNLLKRGILLSAVMSAIDNYKKGKSAYQSQSKSKSNRKTRIDILTIGPYGLGKTEAISKATKLLPGSTQANGQASTGLSLTAIVERLESGMTILKEGPLPRHGVKPSS